MNLCATDFPPDVSEVEALGIETAASTLVEPPRIATAPFALECRRSLSLAFSETRELLIGEVLAVHARGKLTDTKSFYTDPNSYRPIGRLAGSAYCRQGELFEMRRLTYDEWRKQSGR
jgi:flavin reductase (DIM6/NTAB) family NADH-FMN oxidoreductase RutF